MACFSGSAQADPPITPPADPSTVPVITPDLSTPQSSGITAQPALHALRASALRDTKAKSAAYGKLIWRWQSMLGLKRTRFSPLAAKTHSLPYAKWVLKTRKQLSNKLHARAKHWMQRQTNTYLARIRTWSKLLGTSWFDRQLLSDMNIEERYDKAHQLYLNYEERWNASFLLNAFSCIHRYEGAWNSNTGNGYYGGLQMDIPFQRSYGGEYLSRYGTANNWPVEAQIEVAVRAYRSGRGFGPWPNTAHDCGLL